MYRVTEPLISTVDCYHLCRYGPIEQKVARD